MISAKGGNKLVGRVAAMPLTIAAGIVGGLLIAWSAPQLVGFATDTYDDLFPVLRMSGRMVDVGADHVDIHISGQKLRGEECRLHAIYAYTLQADGTRADASVTRIDREMDRRVRGAGAYDIGIWRVQPIDGNSDHAQVWTHHSCVGRDVLSLIADVPLPSRKAAV